MKKTLLIILLTFAVTSVSAEEKWFGAGVKPDPYLQLPYLGLKTPVPTACLGGEAGKSFNAKVNKSGFSLNLPYFKFAGKWPSLSIGRGDNKIVLGSK